MMRSIFRSLWTWMKRLYHAIIDSITTEKGSHFRDMYDMNVLFICTFDPFGKGRGVYTFSERCNEMPELTLDDGVRKIFYNTTKDFIEC